MYLNTKQNGTGTEGSGCQISKHQDQSSPTEHSHIIPLICSEVYFCKEEGSTAAFERFRNTRHQRLCFNIVFCLFCATAPSGPGPPHLRDSQITHNDTPRSVRHLWTSDQLVCRDLHLTTQNTHDRQTSMAPLGFEPTISAGELPQIYALDHVTTGTGLQHCYGDEIRKDEMGETCPKHVMKQQLIVHQSPRSGSKNHLGDLQIYEDLPQVTSSSLLVSRRWTLYYLEVWLAYLIKCYRTF